MISKDAVTNTDNTPKPLMPSIALALAETLAARLCHDLAGILGTMMGALELATDDPDFASEALPVATEAAGTLGRRLRLIRAAWSAGDEPLSADDIRELAIGLPVGRRVRVVLDEMAPGPSFAPSVARLLLNLLLLGVECLQGEGTLRVIGGADADLVITISGPRARWPVGFVHLLTDSNAALLAAAKASPRDLQGPLTALIAHDSGLVLKMLVGPATEPTPPLLLKLA